MSERNEILVVEDSPTQAEKLRYLLEERGYGVAVASNGREGLIAAGERRPALVVSDIVMPEMDGYGLCRAIKEDEMLREIPVILLTSLSDPEDIIRGLEARADCYCTKPYDEEYLLSRIDYLLDNPPGQGGWVEEEELEITVGGQKRIIPANCRRVLDLLLSTYESAVRKNQELVETQLKLKKLNGELEERVAERTAKLVQQAEDLRRSNAELERFAHVASHDLQEPLRSIFSFTQLLARRGEGLFDDRCEHFMERIVTNAGRMQALIRDLLAYSRVNGCRLQLAPTDCGAVMDEVIDALRDRVEENGATITRTQLPEVHGDGAQLETLFRHLLGNAIKFRGERPPEIQVGAERENEAWRISVRDNGMGFEPEYRERIFGVFQRLQGREEHPGTGIGLAICQRIVERHGGRIWAESEVGEGATFHFTLPDGSESK
jgi:two-component system, sensor histidine kinase and response regulator